MPPPNITYDVLNDTARWADPDDCIDLLLAGIWFLYETMQPRYPGCALVNRITRFGNDFEQVKRATDYDPTKLTHEQEVSLFCESELLGTLGYSLWHLRNYLDSAGLGFELKELSEVTCDGSDDDLRRLRGQGFLLNAAATFCQHGFTVDFIERGVGRTPDFFVKRNGMSFACEATTLQPRSGEFDSDEFFWSKIIETVGKKAPKFQSPEFQKGVLIIDCTPIYDAFRYSQLVIGGQLAYFVPPELGGPRSGNVPLVRYDKCKAAEKLNNLEHALRGTNIHTLIIWYRKILISDTGYRRPSGYAVIGTIVGAAFWSYFEKPVVIPGPDIMVRWS